MNLIDLYLSEVGRSLPWKGRADLQAEIRSALEDLLEERARQSGKHPEDEELVLQVLAEYGEPGKVARSYRGEQYLIGPRLYPIFERVLFTVLPILTVLLLVSLVFSLTGLRVEARNLPGLLATFLGNLLGTVITTVGSVTLIFAILERFVPEFKPEADEKPWDPRTLLKVKSPDRIKAVEPILEMLGLGLAIAVFNFFPQLVNIGYEQDGSWWVGFIAVNADGVWQTTLLSEAFFRYLPYLNILWAGIIVFDLILLRRGCWEVWSRWTTVGLKAVGVLLAAVMLTDPSLIGVTAESLLAAGFPADYQSTSDLVVIMNQGVKVLLGLIILFSGVDIVQQLIRLHQMRKNFPLPVE